MPLQIANLASPEAMAVGDQDHAGVAMPVPARFAGRRHQVFDFIGREIFPRASN
jgi:hypothetical protein